MGKVRVSDVSFVNKAKSISAIPDEYVNLPGQISVDHAIERTPGNKVIPGGLCLSNGRTLTGRSTGLTPAATGEQFDSIVFVDTPVAPGEKFVTVPVMVQGYAKWAALEKVEGAVLESKTDSILVVK